MRTEWIEQLRTCVPAERFLLEEPLAAHTTFRIGGPAAVYLIAADTEELRAAYTICTREQIPYYLLGNGSNVLVSDEGFDGVIIQISCGSTPVEYFMENGRQLAKVQAGCMLAAFAKEVSAKGYDGYGYASGIPGTVGGGVVMNAGAYGGEIKDGLVRAEVLTPDGTLMTLSKEELKLSYRHSVIMEKDYLVVSAVFALEPGDPEAILARIQELAKQRREKQPLSYPSAGSTFKRPEGYFAGKLIDDCGLRGYRVGDAQVSEKHCGFVINRGNATAEQVCRLMQDVKRIVLEQTGVTLEPEVRMLGHFPEDAGRRS